MPDINLGNFYNAQLLAVEAFLFLFFCQREEQYSLLVFSFPNLRLGQGLVEHRINWLLLGSAAGHEPPAEISQKKKEEHVNAFTSKLARLLSKLPLNVKRANRKLV